MARSQRVKVGGLVKGQMNNMSVEESLAAWVDKYQRLGSDYEARGAVIVERDQRIRALLDTVRGLEQLREQDRAAVKVVQLVIEHMSSLGDS